MNAPGTTKAETQAETAAWTYGVGDGGGPGAKEVGAGPPFWGATSSLKRRTAAPGLPFKNETVAARTGAEAR